MTTTQHFTVSLEGEHEGVYCAYCGAKLASTLTDTGAFIFSCSCSDALKEQELRERYEELERENEEFQSRMSKVIQVNKLRVRIVAYEEYVYTMKKELQKLLSADYNW